MLQNHHLYISRRNHASHSPINTPPKTQYAKPTFQIHTDSNTINQQLSLMEQQKQNYQLQQRDNQIAKLNQQLLFEENERNKIRNQLEQKTKELYQKEREVCRLLTVVRKFQREEKQSNGLSVQIEALQKYIDIVSAKNSQLNLDTETKMQSPIYSQKQHDNAQLIQENHELRLQLEQQEKDKQVFLTQVENLQQYMKTVTQKNSELQEQCQKQYLEIQKYQIVNEHLQLMEQELKLKEEEIEQLKNQLNGADESNWQGDQSDAAHLAYQFLNQNRNLKETESMLVSDREQLSQFLQAIKAQYKSIIQTQSNHASERTQCPQERNWVPINREEINYDYSFQTNDLR